MQIRLFLAQLYHSASEITSLSEEKEKRTKQLRDLDEKQQELVARLGTQLPSPQ